MPLNEIRGLLDALKLARRSNATGIMVPVDVLERAERVIVAATDTVNSTRPDHEIAELRTALIAYYAVIPISAAPGTDGG